MSKRDLTYTSVKDVITDVERLKSGYKQAGNWTLPQASWHCGLAIDRCLKEIPAGTQSTPEQIEMQETRLLPLIAGGKMPPGLPTPPGGDPARDAPQPLTDAQVDKFIQGLKSLNGSQLKHVLFGAFGVISMDQFKKFMLIHSAHHLSNFTPTT